MEPSKESSVIEPDMESILLKIQISTKHPNNELDTVGRYLKDGWEIRIISGPSPVDRCVRYYMERVKGIGKNSVPETAPQDLKL